jgi:preprotein translocase subunit SecY
MHPFLRWDHALHLASIIVQLLTFAVPYFRKLQKEGDSGRKR